MIANSKKGFTLIELLAVIVILAIIALIATPIILNMINDAKKSASKDSAYGYIEAIEYENQMNMLNNQKYPKIDDGEYSNIEEITSKIKLKGTTPTSGNITIKNGIVTKAELCIDKISIYYDGEKAEVAGEVCNGGTPSKPEKNYEIIVDVNKNGLADVGDEIQVKETNENFYVISNENETINALAKYNLNVGDNAKGIATGLQDKDVKGYISSGQKYGNVSFSNVDGWDDGTIDIQKYAGPVKDAINGYKTALTGKVKDVRLITKTELENLGCSSVDRSCTSSQYSWIYDTAYWTGSGYSNYKNTVWFVTSFGTLENGLYSLGIDCGVRPVITIS